MSTVVMARNASAGPGAFRYQRHRPEKTSLYQLVSKHYPVIRQKLAGEGRALPDYVQREFEDYLKYGKLEHGFLRVRCETCHEERLVAFSCKRRGFCPSCGARRMAESSALLVDEVFPHQPVRQWRAQFSIPVAFSLRQPSGDYRQGVGHRLPRHLHAFGQEGRLFAKVSPNWRGNVDTAVWFCTEPESGRGPIHFHLLFLDGVYVDRFDGSARFRWVCAPTTQELTQLSQTIARRVAQYLFYCRQWIVLSH